MIRAGQFTQLDLLQVEDDVHEAILPLATREKSFGSISPAGAAAIARTASHYASEVRRMAPPWEEYHVELKIAHPSIPDFGGTIDTLFVGSDSLTIFDFKSGKWPAHMEQLACYSLLATTQFPRPIVHTTIIQPRANDGGTIQHRTWDEFDLDEFEDRVKRAAASDELHAGPHCRFCTLRDTCPAFDPDMLVSF